MSLNVVISAGKLKFGALQTPTDITWKILALSSDTRAGIEEYKAWVRSLNVDWGEDHLSLLDDWVEAVRRSGKMIQFHMT